MSFFAHQPGKKQGFTFWRTLFLTNTYFSATRIIAGSAFRIAPKSA
jgi:hypothetical protein